MRQPIKRRPGRRYDHFVTSPTKETRCPKCGASIFVALLDGLKERVEPMRGRALDGRRVFVLQHDRTLKEHDADYAARLLASGELAEEGIYVEHECPK